MKYFLIIISISIFSCTNSNRSSDVSEVMLLQKADTNLYTGRITEYYPEGSQKKFEEIYLDGIKNGMYMSWFKDGVVKVSGEYFGNKRIGVWTWYTKNGDLEYVFNYNKA